jgi:hypothetical protein
MADPEQGGVIMEAIVVAALAKLWPYILAGIGLVIGAFKWRASIIAKERAKQAEAERKARTIADEVDNDVVALPPDKAREELKRWAKP